MTWPPCLARKPVQPRTCAPNLRRLLLKKILPSYNPTRQLTVPSLFSPLVPSGRSRRDRSLNLRQRELANCRHLPWVLLRCLPHVPPNALSRPTPVLRTPPYRLLKVRTSDPHPADTLTHREARTCRLLSNFIRWPPYLLPPEECLTTLLTPPPRQLPLPFNVPRSLPPSIVSVLRNPLSCPCDLLRSLRPWCTSPFPLVLAWLRPLPYRGRTSLVPWKVVISLW